MKCIADVKLNRARGAIFFIRDQAFSLLLRLELINNYFTTGSENEYFHWNRDMVFWIFSGLSQFIRVIWEKNFSGNWE